MSDSLLTVGVAERKGGSKRRKERCVWKARTPASSPEGQKTDDVPSPVTAGISVGWRGQVTVLNS